MNGLALIIRNIISPRTKKHKELFEGRIQRNEKITAELHSTTLVLKQELEEVKVL